ncbi:MAG TPA: hypothetical protein VFC13_23225, partial [Actinomycetes bacterium]|nr:hypothetical protein [Actinomycetes bacterium]
TGEYPHGVEQVGDLPSFLRQFPERLASLPSHASGHPAGAMVLYALLARIWPGLDGAALLTVAIGCLGVLPVAALARDELGQDGRRWALALWVLSPMVVLYTATSADAVFAVALTGAVLAAHRGLVRRSWAWTLAGGVLLWVGAMLTYAAVLLLVFLLVWCARLGGFARSRDGCWVGRRPPPRRSWAGRAAVAGHWVRPRWRRCARRVRSTRPPLARRSGRTCRGWSATRSRSVGCSASRCSPPWWRGRRR